MIVHINEGHRLLAQPTEQTLFVSGAGNAFTDATFVHYWKVHALRGALFPYFAPSCARRIFVSEYTNTFGTDPSMWDGAAVVRIREEINTCVS